MSMPEFPLRDDVEQVIRFWDAHERARGVRSAPRSRSQMTAGDVDVQGVRVDGEHEVRTLHGMIMEYKFDDLRSVYAGSPFIAAIQHRLADALEDADAGHGWRDWQRGRSNGRRTCGIFSRRYDLHRIYSPL